MSEHLRAVVYIVVMAVPVLWWLRTPLTFAAIEPSNYTLRARLWVVLTVALFVAHNFWLFVAVTVVCLLVAGRRDSSPLGLYLFLLLLAPPFQVAVPGFGGIKNLLPVDYLRVLNVVVLLPMAVRLWSDPTSPRLFKIPADKYLMAYIALLFIVSALVTSVTDTLRQALTLFIDIYLPYYAFSRALSDPAKFRDAFGSFAAACVLMAVIAVFETFKGWLLYSPLPYVMGVSDPGGYMLRGDAVRAVVSAGHSIVLGYVLMVAFGLHLGLRDAYPSRRNWAIVLAVLSAGIIVSMSRGPWVGLAAVIIVAVALTAHPTRQLGKLALATILLVPLVMLTPYGAKLISVLPFIGSVDAESVQYRQQLFNVSWDILMLNPIFGSPYYLSYSSMDQLVQGNGFVDMVNSYLGIALHSGFVGLTLFVGIFLSSGVRLARHLLRHPDKDSQDYAIGRALLATLIGVLVTIATVSSVIAVPAVYWWVAGACAAYVNAMQRGRLGEREQVPAEPASYFANRSRAPALSSRGRL